MRLSTREHCRSDRGGQEDFAEIPCEILPAPEPFMNAAVSLPEDVVRACAFLAATGAVVWTAVHLARWTTTAPVDRFLISVIYAVSIIAAVVGFSGAVGILSAWTFCAFGLVGWLGRRLVIGRVPVPQNTSPASLASVRLPVLVAAAAALPALTPALVRAPASWDAMTYHLYFPYRWLETGAIHHIPTVFGDNAPAFAPQNGALIHAWSMAFLSSDALTTMLSVLAIGTTMVALWSLSRSLGADARSAAWVVSWTILLPPILGESGTATVDAFMWSMAIVSLALAARHAAAPALGLAATSGLALGLAAGTKVIGVPLAALIALPVGAMLIGRRAWRDLAAYCACALLAGGPWYVRNLQLYGNPLFPLDLRLGPFSLHGVYGTDAIRAGEFHIADKAMLFETLLRSWLGPTMVLTLLGVVFLIGVCAWSLSTRDAQRTWPRATVAFVAASWFAYYAFVVPHNGETRFAVPTVLLSLCGWAVALSLLRRSFARIGMAVWALMTLAVMPGFLRAMADTYQVLDDRSILAVAIVSAGACGLLWAGSRLTRWRHGTVLAALAVVVLIVASVRLSEASRHREYERQASWGPASLYFVNEDVKPATIGYAGLNIPYILTGPRLRHRVVYCNVKGGVDDGLYEFWRRDPRRYPYHKPAIYRDDGVSFDVWMGCIRRLSADFVIVFAMHPAERKYLQSDADGFPIERQWIRQHPALFTPMRTGPQVEIFAVLNAQGVR